MPYAFSAELKNGYLHVQVTGENSPDTIRRYLGDVVQVCAREGCPNVLIEENLAGPRLGIGDVFSIVSEKSADFRPALRLVAYVDVNATSAASMRFAETVAVNRGATISVFGTVADAETWLRKKLAR
jgi:hypothetical protein